MNDILGIMLGGICMAAILIVIEWLERGRKSRKTVEAERQQKAKEEAEGRETDRRLKAAAEKFRDETVGAQLFVDISNAIRFIPIYAAGGDIQGYQGFGDKPRTKDGEQFRHWSTGSGSWCQSFENKSIKLFEGQYQSSTIHVNVEGQWVLVYEYSGYNNLLCFRRGNWIDYLLWLHKEMIRRVSEDEAVAKKEQEERFAPIEELSLWITTI